MRVTSNTFPESLVTQLRQLSIRQNRLQSEVATGQRVHLPGDDPAAFSRVIGLQGESAKSLQYVDNIDRLLDTGRSTYEVMRGIKRVSDRASELAFLADGVKSDEELKIYAVEVTSLIKQAVEAANSKFGNRYLLSGTLTDQPPFQMTTDADGKVTSVTFVGNTSLAEVEIAEGSTIASHTLGENTTGSGPRGLVADSRFGADLFGHLISLQNNLLAGDTDAIQGTDLPRMLRDENNLLVHLGVSGAMLSRLEAAKANAKQRVEATEILISQEVDTDLAETLVRLNQMQYAYQAALQSGGKLLNTSLMDYLQ